MVENLNIKLTAEVWLKILIEKFEDKIRKLGIVDTNFFINSFIGDVISNSNGDLSRIELAFAYYGKFPDMGVGKGITLADVGHKGRRRQRRWFNPVFWRQYKRLVVILTKKAALRGITTIIETLKSTT